jgi:TRAP-type transport system periplasmic protein
MKALFVKAFFLVTLIGGAQNALSLEASITWKLATGYPADSFHGQNLDKFAQDMEKATDGKLKIKLHPNNSLAKLTEIVKAVQAGRIEAGEVIMSVMTKEAPLAGADSVPFVVNSYEDATKMWRYQRPLVEKQMADLGLTVLYAVPWPPQGLYSTKPIQSASDLRGAKMRTYNAATVRIAQMVGAGGVDVPMAEVSAALAAGKMDSMITSAVTGVQNKVWGQLNYYYEINAWFPKNLVFVNTAAFNALPQNWRDAVRNAARDAELRGWALSQAAAKSSNAELKAHGMKVERVPSGLERDLKSMGERFSREWIKTVGHEANQIFLPYYFQDK